MRADEITVNDLFMPTDEYPIYKLEDFFDQCLTVVDPYENKEYSPAQIGVGGNWIRLGNDKTIKNIDMFYMEIYFSGDEDEPFEMVFYFFEFEDRAKETFWFRGTVVLEMLAPADWSMTKSERREFVQFLINNRREMKANND